MKLVALVCLCLVTRCGITAAGVNGVVKVSAAEGSDVILPCSLSTKKNIQSQLFDWRKDGQKNDREVFMYDAGSNYNNGRPGQSETFKRRVSHFPDQLKYGNASIIINDTKVTDSGNYTCGFPRLQPPQIFYVELVVSAGAVAAPKPHVTSLDQTKYWSRLQCEVRGNPEPHLQWQDSAGNNLTAEKPQVSKSGDCYNVILQVTVTKTDYYRCVATQETIKHRIAAETHVYISGPEVVKLFAALGSDVILPCSLSTKENIQSKLFDWKKDGPTDEREVFMYDAGIHYNNGRSGQSKMFKGRVSHFPDQLKYGNASITITNTEVTDSGNYTCDFPRLQPRQIFRVELVVVCDLKDRTGENITGAAPEPYVTSLDQTKDWSRLQCEVRGASPEPHLQWQDSAGNILTAEEPQVAKSGDRYNVILQVTVTKTDRYRCVATQETISHQTRSEIYVYIGGGVLKDRTGENIPGAAPKPSVTSLKTTKYSWRLQCEVHGNPVPKVEWQDSDGNILPAEKPQVSKSGDRYDVILNANVNKTDYYRCVATQETISHQIYVYIHGPKVVEDGSDVILPCSLSTKENIQSKMFDWKKDGPRNEREVFLYDAGIHYNNGRSGQSETFKGRVSHFPDQLEYGNASIIIRNTKVTDSGNYTCDFLHLQPPQKFYVELVVGAAPKPSVTSLKTTKYWWQLQCEVHGNPEPKVEWQDSDGNILPAEKPQVSKSGDRYDVILNANVTKTNRYRCVATQETIYHQTYRETDVYIHESSTGSVGWTVLGIVLFVGGVLAVLVVVLRAMGCITLNWNKDEENTRNSPDANSGASIPLKSTDNN